MFKNCLTLLSLVAGIFLGLTNAENCIVCDSAKDANCAKDPSQLNPESCKTALNLGCYSRVIESRTLRGCFDELNEDVRKNCTNDSNCQNCLNINNGSGCNNGVFPVHRVTCHQCSGNLTSICSHDASARDSTVCRIYDESDQCFIRKTNDTIERGCLSDSETKCRNAKHCFICTGHGCNNLNSNNTEIPLAPSSASMTTPSILVLSILIFCAAKFLR